MSSKIRGYIANQEGTAAIEFAFVLPILVLFIFGMLQFGFLIFEQATLQGSLSTAAREGKTGYPNPSDPGNMCTGGTCKTDSSGNITNLGDRWQQVHNKLLTLTKGLFSKGPGQPTALTFSATAYPDFASLEAAMNAGTLTTGGGGTQNDLGSGGQVVVYTATYPAPSYLNPILGLTKGNGMITAITIERNEGF